MNRSSTLECFPLSPMQQGMLFHYLKEPRSGVDIEQLVVHLPEPIDTERMERAWNWLVQRHQVLRVRFLWEGTEQAQQEVAARVRVPFETRSKLELAENQQEAELQSFLAEDRVNGFDMG